VSDAIRFLLSSWDRAIAMMAAKTSNPSNGQMLGATNSKKGQSSNTPLAQIRTTIIQEIKNKRLTDPEWKNRFGVVSTI
jgi:hypothetical protein